MVIHLQVANKKSKEASWIFSDFSPNNFDLTGNSDIQVRIAPDAAVLVYFNLIVTDKLFNIIVTQINIYAEQY